jgi:hypothetical protein
MPPSSLFNLILKIIGLFFIRDILESLSHTLSVLVYMPQYSSASEATYNLAVSLPPLVLYTLLVWLFIFKSDSLVNLLKLDKNFPQSHVDIRLERKTVLTAAVIIAGGWLLVNEIPEFFRHVIYYYQERKMYVRMTRPDVSYIVMSAIKIAIGFFLIVFHKPIVEVIEWGKATNVLPPKKKKKILVDKES